MKLSEEVRVSESDRSSDSKQDAAKPKKAYVAPTLTECGSVAKLTMAKGTTQVEITPNKKRQCL